jgi:IclR family acetate operon transcriptional repressor
MTVKQVRSASRTLATLEVLAEHQPIGVRALARLLDDDKSAVQRALVTLADAGWIRPAVDASGQWELTTRALVVAEHAQRRSGLRQRARAALEALQVATGESTLLAVPDTGRIVAVDVVESQQLVRTAPYIGMVIPATTSAAGQAILAHFDNDELGAFLGYEPTAVLRAKLALVRERGWSLNAGDVVPGASSVGAPILDRGRPLGVLAISAPTERMPPEEHPRLGALVAKAADGLRAGHS